MTRKSFACLFTISLTILLPVWHAIGRTLFGVGGWMLIATLFVTGPILFSWLASLTVLTVRRPDIKNGGGLHKQEFMAWIAVVLSQIILQLAIVDSDDTKDMSVLTKLFGWSNGASTTLWVWSAVAGFVSLLWLSAVVGKIRRQSDTTAIRPVQ